MFKWDYCRVDEVRESADGPFVAVSYDRPLKSEDPSADEAGAVLIFTTYEVIERLGAEGCEAFHIEKTEGERT
jgi:hypothetical protein